LGWKYSGAGCWRGKKLQQQESQLSQLYKIFAASLAYYLMYQWLQNFAFRIHIDVELFLLTIVVSEVIAWLTVGYHKGAVANPVKSLKAE
jgi:hypothetical protein